ncbi:MAG: carboxypeptidase-like regulatory domain-containing protein [Acidobacteria bacterium]|nr:carboxypeptidase-like regulatory domain-containing protein [Acidobacteriota bacterium]
METNTKRWLGFIASAFAALLTLSSVVPAAELVGNVVFSGEAVADAVISIEGVKLEGQPDATVYEIDHRDLNFVPHVLAVRTGSAVRFENSDGMPCRIYSTSSAGNFVLRRQDGKPMTITFDRAGVIQVRCADHGRMYAYVIVKENPYFALTDAKGQYEISNVPPGRYTLQVWYEGKVIKSKTIEVGTAKQTIDFKASRPQPNVRAGRVLDPISLTPAEDRVPGSIFSHVLEALTSSPHSNAGIPVQECAGSKIP